MCQLLIHHANNQQSAMCHEHFDLEVYPNTCNCFNMSLHILGDVILDRQAGHPWCVLVLLMSVPILITARTWWPRTKILRSLSGGLQFDHHRFWHGYVLHGGITYKSRVPHTSQMTSRLLRNTTAAMRVHNVLCNSYNTRPLLCARITCYVTVITV
jgi:hypothetical protein